MTVPTGMKARNHVEASAIPAELRERRQWVVWRYEERDGKPTKVPYNARTGGKALSTKPATWSPFDVALQVRERYDGIGFVFSKDDPYVGIDLDHARDAETGEITAPWAEEVLRRLDSYTEVSPSGTGLHVIVRGELPGKGIKEDRDDGTRIEIYDRSRYFTCTGQHIAGPTTIEDRPDAVLALCKEYRPASAHKSAPPESVTAAASGLVLSPNAEAPASKLATLLASKQRFLHTWNGSRSDLTKPDGSRDASRYDYALVGFTLDAGWEPQEIADLVIEFRRRHNLDLAKALRADYIARTLHEAVSAREENQPFSVASAHLEQNGTNRAATYTLVLGTGQRIQMGTARELLSANMSAASLLVAGVVMTPPMRNQWKSYVQAWMSADALVVYEGESEAESMNDLVVSFFRDRWANLIEPDYTLQDSMRVNESWVASYDSNGTGYFSLSRFVEWLRRMRDDTRASAHSLSPLLNEAGYRKVGLMRYGPDGSRQARVWQTPGGLLDALAPAADGLQRERQFLDHVEREDRLQDRAVELLRWGHVNGHRNMTMEDARAMAAKKAEEEGW